jgi:hypothetical protein
VSFLLIEPGKSTIAGNISIKDGGELVFHSSVSDSDACLIAWGSIVILATVSCAKPCCQPGSFADQPILTEVVNTIMGP